MGEWWSGYSVFEFDNMLNYDIDNDEIEVNEVTLDESDKHRIDEWTGKKTEMEKLLKYDAVKIIPPKEADRTRQKSNRILPSRFVITKKPDEKTPGRYITKARWCIRGYLDPDVTKLSTQSPTLTIEAMSLLLQLSASNGWDFGICDVEGAFLQGKELHREAGELFVELPPGGGLLVSFRGHYYMWPRPYTAWWTLRNNGMQPCEKLWLALVYNHRSWIVAYTMQKWTEFT